MKTRIIQLLAATLLIFFTSCSDDEGTTIAPSLTGEWHLTSWNSETPTDFDVYMELRTDGTFRIYQRVETSTYVCYTGNFNASDNRLTGRYSDGENWGASYTYEVAEQTLTLTSETADAEVSVYTKETIPDEVRNAPEVRSVLPEGFKRPL
ncbi:lipocalin family protein [Alistipes sp.]|uniref:lipocalin family protein n=1 Tax=Alistipes sp. TaxID=1872444 RepID=UPI0025B94254|nr:lipocalin family protein [Alistipes sp.]